MRSAGVKGVRKRWLTLGVLVALGIGGVALMYALRVPHEPTSADAPPDEHDAPSERPDRPPAPRRPDLPPLPATEDPDTGYAQAPVEEAPPAAFAVLRGTIVDTAGRPQAGGFLIADEDDCPRLGFRDGRLQEPFFQPLSCTWTALRYDGALPTRSDPVKVRLEPGRDVAVEWVLPAERTGGIGVWIGEHDEGIVVRGVLPGSPAWEAGLEEGDVIVEVDGTPTALLSPFDFQQVMTGPEATDVRFVVAYETDDGWVEEDRVATRAFLEPDNNN